jgi:TolB protein
MKMSKITLFIVLLTSFLGSQQNYTFSGEIHLRNIKMLATEGENAEAYFSFDESQIIYQSSFGPYECDQIFTMNLDGSDKELISTG